MKYIVTGKYGTKFEIDTDIGKVFKLNTEIKQGKEIVHRMLYKGFKDIKEAYKYLSICERLPV